MVDLSKKLNIPAKKRVSEPNELYASLDRRSDAGPLRPAQEAVLENGIVNGKKRRT